MSTEETTLSSPEHMQLPLTSRYGIKEEVIVLVIQQIFIECLLCARSLGAGELKNSVCTGALTKTVSSPGFFSLMLTSLRRRLVPGMESTCIFPVPTLPGE